MNFGAPAKVYKNKEANKRLMTEGSKWNIKSHGTVVL
jgi:hypothetical protein